MNGAGGRTCAGRSREGGCTDNGGVRSAWLFLFPWQRVSTRTGPSQRTPSSGQHHSSAPDCRTASANAPPPGTISRGREADRRAGMISPACGARLPPNFTTVTGDFFMFFPCCACTLISQGLYSLIIKREDTVSFSRSLSVFLFSVSLRRILRCRTDHRILPGSLPCR